MFGNANSKHNKFTNILDVHAVDSYKGLTPVKSEGLWFESFKNGRKSKRNNDDINLLFDEQPGQTTISKPNDSQLILKSSSLSKIKNNTCRSQYKLVTDFLSKAQAEHENRKKNRGKLHTIVTKTF